MNSNNIIELISEKIRENPDSPLFLSLASELKKQDRLEEAIETLIEGLKKNPEYLPARIALAKLYKENHMDSEYVKELEKILQRDSNQISVRKMIADYYKNKGLIEEAIKHYKEILILTPYDKEAYSFINNHSNNMKTQSTKEPTLVQESAVDYSYDKKVFSETSDIDFDGELLKIEKLSSEQRYKEALLVAESILLKIPSHKKALQKREELKYLIKLINKPKESAIKRLRNFKIALIKLYFRSRFEI
ncbi:MAG TPA: hypothetical protein HPP56_02535 [Nitrospirae bacterium]|nr:hypothetical protein [Nitrospirota bacterium]